MTDFTDLLDGYQRFRTSEYRRHRDRWSGFSEGQSPRVMVIACSDSRVDPAQIFDTVPGEIFVVRNVANLVPPFEDDASRHGVSAALEFAVNQLEVPEIVVLGHGACGGVGAALSQRFKGAPNGEGGFIAHWVDMLDPAREQVVAKHGTGPEAARELELETVRVSLTNLTTFPFVSKRLAEGRLKLHGAYFAIADGVLHLMGDDGEFAPA
jgi:carbonic anhydrase